MNICSNNKTARVQNQSSSYEEIGHLFNNRQNKYLTGTDITAYVHFSRARRESQSLPKQIVRQSLFFGLLPLHLSELT